MSYADQIARIERIIDFLMTECDSDWREGDVVTGNDPVEGTVWRTRDELVEIERRRLNYYKRAADSLARMEAALSHRPH
jgi:hypothetical protein